MESANAFYKKMATIKYRSCYRPNPESCAITDNTNEAYDKDQQQISIISTSSSLFFLFQGHLQSCTHGFYVQVLWQFDSCSTLEIHLPTPSLCNHTRSSNSHKPPTNSSFQLIQMFQPRQHNLLTRLLNLPRQKHFIENRIDLYPIKSYQPPSSTLSPSHPTGTHLIEVKHQIQFAHVPKKAIQHLHKEMNRLQIRQLVVVRVDAYAEE